jgi:hypothetical protein
MRTTVFPIRAVWTAAATPAEVAPYTTTSYSVGTAGPAGIPVATLKKVRSPNKTRMILFLKLAGIDGVGYSIASRQPASTARGHRLMDSTTREGILVSQPPPRPAVPPPQLLVQIHPVPSTTGGRWRRLHMVPAWILSAIFHVALLTTFMHIQLQQDAKSSETETAVIDAPFEDVDKAADALNNVEVGMDPDRPTNFDVPRIEDVSVPGPAINTEAVGILRGPDAAPTTLPAPAGFGNNGQEGNPESLLPGKGSFAGLDGGLGGLKMMPGGFGGRSGATRERMVREGGGNTHSEAAVALGLKWLALHQAPDGRWALADFPKHGQCNCTTPGPANDIAGTAFGLLPFLGAGFTHKGGANKDNPYAKNIERALKYLLLHQNSEGAFHGDMYAQGLATITVCEAFGLTSDPVLQKPAQRALLYICKAQNARGGWDYTPRGPTPDTSIGGWQIMALKSGQMSGLDVPSVTLANASKWLDEWAGDREGSLYGYRQPRNMNPSEGGASPQSMVAIGLLTRQYLGWGPRHPGLIKGAHWLLRPENLPAAPNRSHMYFHYYATQVMHHMGGGFWKSWNPMMRDWLIRTQDQGKIPGHGHQKGSWESKSDWWCAPGGRIMMTSMCLLSLEVYYRHLPLYRRDMGGSK